MLSLDRQNALRERYRSETSGWQPATEVFADCVRSQLAPSSCLLDLGCGRGGLIEQLAHPLSQTVGVDPDWVSLREHRLGLNGAVALGRLPFAENSFDVVYASWVLEHWEYPERELVEIGRILKPNGSFIFITPNRGHWLIALNRLLGSAESVQKQLVSRLYGRAEADTFPIFYRVNDPRSLNSVLANSNMRLKTLHCIGDPTYLAFTEGLFRVLISAESLTPRENKLHLVGVLQKSVSELLQ